jgi:hypothetical protein
MTQAIFTSGTVPAAILARFGLGADQRIYSITP